MTEFPCCNNECVCELFDPQISSFCSEKDFVDIVHWSLDYVFSLISTTLITIDNTDKYERSFSPTLGTVKREPSKIFF